MGHSAEIRYGTIPKAQAELEKLTSELEEIQKSSKMLKEEVDDEDIATIVSKWTNIPVSKMLEGSAKLQLETGTHPGILKDNVCSPGGSTIRGVAALEENGLRNACLKSLDAIMNMKVLRVSPDKKSRVFEHGSFCRVGLFVLRRLARLIPSRPGRFGTALRQALQSLTHFTEGQKQ